MDRLHTLLRPAIAVDWTRLTVYSYNSLADNAYRLTASPVFSHDNRLLLIIDCCKPPFKSVFVDNIYIRYNMWKRSTAVYIYGRQCISKHISPRQLSEQYANVYRNIFPLAHCRSNILFLLGLCIYATRSNTKTCVESIAQLVCIICIISYHIIYHRYVLDVPDPRRTLQQYIRSP